MALYTNPKNGDTIESNLDLGTCIGICLAAKSGFPYNLATSACLAIRDNRLSATQEFWLHKLANEAEAKANGSEAPTDSLAISPKLAAIFARLSGNRRITVDGMTLSAWQGAIYVKSEETVWSDQRGYYRPIFLKLSPEGSILYRGKEDERALSLIAALNAEGFAYLAQRGRETGRCCFCSRLLTDDRSVEVGYGSTCAGKYGLPWGIATRHDAPTEAPTDDQIMGELLEANEHFDGETQLAALAFQSRTGRPYRGTRYSAIAKAF